MNFHILGNLRENAWGGGNQFQKALKKQLNNLGVYTDSIDTADVVLVNSHHFQGYLLKIFNLKRKNKDIIILHRIDGPISIVRGDDGQFAIDKVIMSFSNNFSDGVVYQSSWSRKQCMKQGIGRRGSQVTIHNAPDPSIFYADESYEEHSKKIKIITSSWSTNKRKGHDIYKFLDDNLDYSKYEVVFIGNTLVKFKNILHKKSMSSKSLAFELRKGDIFIHPSQMESCSNSLLEAMSCGLVPIMRNNTSHPEIVKYGGVLFDGNKDILKAIDKVAKNIALYRESLNPPLINDVANSYIDFAMQIRSQGSPGTWSLIKVWLGSIFMRQNEYFRTKFSSRKV